MLQQVVAAVLRGEGDKAIVDAVGNLDSLPIPGDQLKGMLQVTFVPLQRGLVKHIFYPISHDHCSFGGCFPSGRVTQLLLCRLPSPR